jgi:hypothetical protein
MSLTLSDRSTAVAVLPAATAPRLARLLSHVSRSCFDETYRMERQRKDPWHLLYAAGRESWELEQAAARAAHRQPTAASEATSAAPALGLAIAA